MSTPAVVLLTCIASTLAFGAIGWGIARFDWRDSHHNIVAQTFYGMASIAFLGVFCSSFVFAEHCFTEYRNHEAQSQVVKAGYIINTTKTTIDGYAWTMDVRPTTDNNCVDRVYVDYGEHYTQEDADYALTTISGETTGGQRCLDTLNR